MDKNKNHSKHNLTVIVVGFTLIILVTALFFLKSSFFDNKEEQSLNTEKTQEEADDLEKYASISSEELLKKINTEDDFKIIDIRNQDSFLIGHIVDSENITPEALIQNVESFDKNKQYYIVDDLGFTPLEKNLMAGLFEAGFQKVAYLEGGIYNWTAELNPTVEFGNPNSLSDQSKVNYITSDELNKLISEEYNILALIDVRDESNYIAGHLKGALSIPLDDLEARRKEIPGYKRIVLYDDNGIFAFQGAVRLFDMGILNVFTLSDGLKGWKEKGFEVVK